jgi:hypothetical protein
MQRIVSLYALGNPASKQNARSLRRGHFWGAHSPPNLEVHLNTQLHHARIAETCHRSESCTERCCRAGGVIGDGAACAQVPEIRVIENIERFCAQLQLHVFAEPDVLRQREVNTLRGRPISRAARRITHFRALIRGSGGLLQSEAGAVEPLVYRVWSIFVGIAKQARPATGDQRRNVSDPCGVIAGVGNVEWQAGKEADDAGNLPTAQDFADKVFLCAMERQLVNVVPAKYLTAIENRPAVLRVKIQEILRGGAN